MTKTVQDLAMLSTAHKNNLLSLKKKKSVYILPHSACRNIVTGFSKPKYQFYTSGFYRLKGSGRRLAE